MKYGKPDVLVVGSREVSVMFWGCVTYNGVGILVPVDVSNGIDSHKYAEILEASLWTIVSKYFAGKQWIIDNVPVHRSVFTQEWKEK